MNEDVVILTPAEANAVRQQRERREVDALAEAWLKLVAEAMSHGLDYVTTSTSTTCYSAPLLNEAVKRVALRLQAHGWAWAWWKPTSESIVRLHWSEHPEPKAANDPGMAGLGAQGWARG